MGKLSKRISNRVVDILIDIKTKRAQMNDNASVQAADEAINDVKGTK
jgi:hypothetical protein